MQQRARQKGGDTERLQIWFWLLRAFVLSGSQSVIILSLALGGGLVIRSDWLVFDPCLGGKKSKPKWQVAGIFSAVLVTVVSFFTWIPTIVDLQRVSAQLGFQKNINWPDLTHFFWGEGRVSPRRIIFCSPGSSLTCGIPSIIHVLPIFFLSLSLTSANTKLCFLEQFFFLLKLSYSMDFQLLMTAVCNSKIVSFLCYLVQPYTVSGVRFVVVGGGGGG